MAEPTPPPEGTSGCQPDAGFVAWLGESGGSLAITTYQAGKLLLIGWQGQQLSFLPRQFPKPMGIDVAGDRLVLAVRHEVLWFYQHTALAHSYDLERPGRYDALFLPRLSYHTGELHLHDLALGTDGLWVVNTRFSCLCELSSTCSFVARWRPPFVSALVPEDRCHLNGLALVDGVPGYVTALARSDRAGGWREHQRESGIVLDVRQEAVVLEGLAMPHSPAGTAGRCGSSTPGRASSFAGCRGRVGRRRSARCRATCAGSPSWGTRPWWG